MSEQSRETTTLSHSLMMLKCWLEMRERTASPSEDLSQIRKLYECLAENERSRAMSTSTGQPRSMPMPMPMWGQPPASAMVMSGQPQAMPMWGQPPAPPPAMSMSMPMPMWGQPPAPAPAVSMSMSMSMSMQLPAPAMAMPMSMSGQPTYLGKMNREQAKAELEQALAETEQSKQMSSYIDQRRKNLLRERELHDDGWFPQCPVPCFCDPCRQYQCNMKKNLPTNRLELEEDKRVFETKKKKLEYRKNAMEVQEKQFLEEWKAEEHLQGILQHVTAVYMRRFEEFDEANNPGVTPIEGCPYSKGKGNDLIG